MSGRCRRDRALCIGASLVRDHERRAAQVAAFNNHAFGHRVYNGCFGDKAILWEAGSDAPRWKRRARRFSRHDAIRDQPTLGIHPTIRDVDHFDARRGPLIEPTAHILVPERGGDVFEWMQECVPGLQHLDHFDVARARHTKKNKIHSWPGKFFSLSFAPKK